MNATKAFEKYQQHAKLTGNATSQAMLGFFYSTGYGDVPVDQAQALLYYTFAAISGDQGAEMALGYRYWTGIGVSEDCMLALDWYESAAERCESDQITARLRRFADPPSYGSFPQWPSWRTHAAPYAHQALRPRGRRVWLRREYGLDRPQRESRCHQGFPRSAHGGDLGRCPGVLAGTLIVPVVVRWFTVHHSSTQIEETSNHAIVWARSTIMVVSTLRLEE